MQNLGNDKCAPIEFENPTAYYFLVSSGEVSNSCSVDLHGVETKQWMLHVSVVSYLLTLNKMCNTQKHAFV